MYADGEVGRFRLVSWKTVSSFIFWTVLPIVHGIYDFFPFLKMLINGNTDKGVIIPLCFTLMGIMNFVALPIVRTILVVNAKIPLDAIWNSKRILTVLGILLFGSGMVLQSVLIYTELNNYDTNLLILTIPVGVLGLVIQNGTTLLVFSIAVSWISQDTKNLEKASRYSILAASTELLSNYNAIQNSSGPLLLVLCFNFGINMSVNAWIALETFKTTPFIFVLSNVIIVLGAFFMLSVLTTLANNAYAGLSLYQKKLR